MRSFLLISFTKALMFFTGYLFGQHSSPDTITALNIVEKPVFDGNLSEPFWQTAHSISNFTQRELDFGKPSTEETKVAIVYDNVALYIGLWCFQSPKSIISKFLHRDFDYDTEDNFEVIISPFNDRRNGYLFIINPLGARADLLVSGQESSNIDWNGVWDAEATITTEGWFAEIRIPFNTLQFRKDSIHIWAINFERNIRHKNEQVFWQGWSRDYELENIAQAGTLAGIKNIGYSRRFELKPYVLGGFNYNAVNSKQTTLNRKIGADLNVNLTPTLKLNVTTNTDFAQVEVDRIPVNLTRFNLFYPEKREFFLEGNNNYQFSLGNNNEIFYTRRIGVESLQTVPLLAGARLFGKTGKNNFGILSIETGQRDTVPATNNSVFRYRRDIGSQSYIGGIITLKINDKFANQVVGIDGSYITSKFLKDKNLIISGALAKSMDNYTFKANSLSYRFFVDYPNDLIDHYIGVSGIQSDFNPALGFLQRTNYDALHWIFRFMPRWFTKYGVRKMYFRPWGFTLYRTRSNREIESFYNESRPLGFFLKTGDSFEFNLIQNYDRVDKPFDLSSTAFIPPGKYWMQLSEVQLASFRGRRIWAEFAYQWGDYYSGKIRKLGTETGFNVSRHLNLEGSYAYNDISLAVEKVYANELALYINYAFNTRLYISIFEQWNSLDEIIRSNVRLQWIPRIGTDFFLVFNQGYDDIKNFRVFKPATNTGVAKLVWRFTF